MELTETFAVQWDRVSPFRHVRYHCVRQPINQYKEKETVMGCLRRILIGLALLWNLAGWALVAIVIGDANTLGEAALINKNDAMVIFVASLGGVLLTLMLVILVWSGSRRRRKLELAATSTATTSQVSTPSQSF
jgi:hypothetical protein